MVSNIALHMKFGHFFFHPYCFDVANPSKLFDSSKIYTEYTKIFPIYSYGSSNSIFLLPFYPEKSVVKRNDLKLDSFNKVCFYGTLYPDSPIVAIFNEHKANLDFDLLLTDIFKDPFYDSNNTWRKHGSNYDKYLQQKR